MSELLTPPRRLHLPRTAPNIEGFATSIYEVNPPHSELDPENPYNYNNHHLHWVRAAFGKLALYQTLRDLDQRQEPVLKDVHAWYHRQFDPPPKPRPKAAMQRIDDAYHAGELLRTGGIHTPEYTTISEELFTLIKKEYEVIR